MKDDNKELLEAETNTNPSDELENRDLVKIFPD